MTARKALVLAAIIWLSVTQAVSGDWPPVKILAVDGIWALEQVGDANPDSTFLYCTITGVAEVIETPDFKGQYQFAILRRGNELKAITGLWVERWKGETVKDFMIMTGSYAKIDGQPIKSKLVEKGDQLRLDTPIDFTKDTTVTVFYGFSGFPGRTFDYDLTGAKRLWKQAPPHCQSRSGEASRD